MIGNRSGLPDGTSRDILAVYTPHELRRVTIDGRPLGAATQTELGSLVHLVEVEVPPGETRTVVFEMAGDVPSWPYRLEVLPQAMAHPDQLTVSVDGIPGLEPAPQFRGPLVGPVQIGVSAGGD